jgi:competence protein ComGC
MKRMVIVILMVNMLILLLAVPAFAGGDQVRGENSTGPANQVQVQDPPPFQP